MAATIISFPPDPASVYRPMPLHVRRTTPAGSQVVWIKVADASDVSTHGNGLQVGQVFMRHANVNGAVPLMAGQTLHIYDDGGPYTGVWTCTNTWGTGPWYAVIDAPSMGDYTPTTGAMRVWLDHYTILVKLLIYTTPAGTPQQVVLRAQPSDAVGNTFINVDVVLRDYFNHRIESFIKPMSGVPVQSAHGITAIFYRLHVVELYDSPNVDMSDPFDGTHDIHVDNVASASTLRQAVNAVHPYASSVLDWTDADMSAFKLDTGGAACSLLTMAPQVLVPLPSWAGGPTPGRRVLASPGDWLWLTALTSAADGWAVPSGVKLLAYRIEPTASSIGSIAVDIAGPSAAVAVGYGPGNIAAILGTATRYAVWLNDENAPSGSKRLCEPVEVVIDTKCGEGRRPFAWLNKLGGIDAHTFTGREIYSTKVKRATVRKPYGAGTGYDWRERTYRAEPERTRTVSTKPLPVEYRRWLAEDMGESANVLAMADGLACPVILLSDELQGGDTSPVGHKPITVSYRLGVDNLSQQA